MANEVSTLTLAVDSRPVKGAAADLDNLAKAGRNSESAAESMRKAYEDAGGGISAAARGAGIAIGVMVAAATGAIIAFDQLVKRAGDFQDLAEKTGTSAEGIASLALAAGTAGTAMETIAQASAKLTRGLTGVDDETKDAGAAIAALGLNIEEFKKLDAADQMDAVAKALAGFEDGASKTAVAMALFGRAGAELLPFLNELGAAGGRQTILTQEQIELADQYADRQARLRTQIGLYSSAIATQAIPAFNSLAEAALDLLKEIGGVEDGVKGLKNSNAIKDFANDSVLALSRIVDAADGVYRAVQIVGKGIGALAAAGALAAQGEFRAAQNVFSELGKDVDSLLQKQLFSQRVQKAIANQQNASAAAEAQRRKLSFEGRVTGGGGSEKVSEAERYLESLRRQLQGARDLSVEEKLLEDIQAGRLGKVTALQQESLVQTARQIDAIRKQKDEERDALKIAQDRQRARNQEYDDAIKAVQANEKATKDRLASLLDNTPSKVLEKQRQDVEFLTRAYTELKDENGQALLTEEQYLEAVSARLNLTADKITKTKNVAEELGMTFASAFEDAIVSGKKLSDVLGGLAQDIMKIFVRKTITEPIGGFFSDLFSGFSFGSLFGGRAIGGPVSAGGIYQVNERGPEMLSVAGKEYLMMGNQSGKVSPGVGSSVNIVQNFTVGDVATVSRLKAEIATANSALVAQLSRRTQTAW